ncbi:hypothetical protein JMN32_17610 [Fulvivirga sp. 29W222]|uniref:Uncharacterized protein n=1 Tax=Fulvivirga marina TaxID=2494733 RepID=A0A937G197_9BACT|nr:hypothetical protein [Fulvivirga marina]MBL6448140.1 hypothetical protein [Fulvivirga marina]
MKNLTLTFLLILLIFRFSWAQELSLQNITTFDKLVVIGETDKITLNRGSEDRPMIKVTGATEKDVISEINAGILTLTIHGSVTDIQVYNSNLKRIETSGAVDITGADIIGSDGNYLVVSFDRSHGGDLLVEGGDRIEIKMPAIDIDIPEIGVAVDLPEFDFDFDIAHDFNFRGDLEIEEYNYLWKEHKEELKRWTKEWHDVTREVMKEASDEIKRVKKEMKKLIKTR